MHTYNCAYLEDCVCSLVQYYGIVNYVLSRHALLPRHTQWPCVCLCLCISAWMRNANILLFCAVKPP